MNDPAAAKPLGILGGTFDPVHCGHLRLAEAALHQLDLDGVLWLPAGQPRHRQPPEAHAAHRLAMVQLAIAGRPEFAVDAGEVTSTQPSYMVPTLQRLRAHHGMDRALVLVLGADAFLTLDTWHRWQELFDLAHVAVTTRPGFSLSANAMSTALFAVFDRRRIEDPSGLSAHPAGSILTFAMEALDTSATELRRSLASGEGTRNLLPDTVLDYISRHRLYC